MAPVLYLKVQNSKFNHTQRVTKRVQSYKN
jgi:hypothetical protein